MITQVHLSVIPARPRPHHHRCSSLHLHYHQHTCGCALTWEKQFPSLNRLNSLLSTSHNIIVSFPLSTINSYLSMVTPYNTGILVFNKRSQWVYLSTLSDDLFWFCNLSFSSKFVIHWKMQLKGGKSSRAILCVLCLKSSELSVSECIICNQSDGNIW